jgi:HSP90 family molecular chaperone
VGDLQTDIADHQASSKKMKEEFAELLKEVQVARGDKAEHIQTAAQLVEVTAELQAAQASIEVRGGC